MSVLLLVVSVTVSSSVRGSAVVNVSTGLCFTSRSEQYSLSFFEAPTFPSAAHTALALAWPFACGVCVCVCVIARAFVRAV